MDIIRKIYKTLQHPLAKLILAPMGLILFGLIAGINESGNVNWTGIICLTVIVIFGQLLEHYFYLYFTAEDYESAPRIVLYICEASILIATVVFLFKHNWISNILLIMYIVILHIHYIPYPMTFTANQIILNVICNGFILNCIAYFSQAGYVTLKLLLHFIPLILVALAVQLQVNYLRELMTYGNLEGASKNYPNISTILMFVAIGLGFYYSLPSKSYFIVQITFLILTIAVSLPFRVETKQIKECQNKLNHATVTQAVFALLYALSYIW